MVVVLKIEMARVRNIYEDLNFGHSSSHMEMHYYVAEDSTDTTGLERYVTIIAKSFGLAYKGGGDIFYDLVLKGCVINNTLYGDTTNIVLSVGWNNEDNLPDDITLNQNYPNPFNPETMIKYQIQKRGFVTLKVFDMLGREVADLVNEEKLPGEYLVEFNAGTLASGVYIYSLRVNDFVKNNKMTLLK